MGRFLRIAVLENEVEAGLVETLLTQRHIPHFIRSYFDSVLDGVFQAQRGWGCIMAPEEHERTILEILQEIRRGSPENGPS